MSRATARPCGRDSVVPTGTCLASRPGFGGAIERATHVFSVLRRVGHWPKATSSWPYCNAGRPFPGRRPRRVRRLSRSVPRLSVVDKRKLAPAGRVGRVEFDHAFEIGYRRVESPEPCVGQRDVVDGGGSSDTRDSVRTRPWEIAPRRHQMGWQDCRIPSTHAIRLLHDRRKSSHARPHPWRGTLGVSGNSPDTRVFRPTPRRTLAESNIELTRQCRSTLSRSTPPGAPGG